MALCLELSLSLGRVSDRQINTGWHDKSAAEWDEERENRRERRRRMRRDEEKDEEEEEEEERRPRSRYTEGQQTSGEV